jgi:multiple sugar transport system substrate-binding protein
MFKKGVIGFVLLFLLAGFVFAGGTGEGEAKAAEVPPEFQCDIDWRQFEGDELNIIFFNHPWQEQVMPLIPEFEALTGIKVNATKLPHDEGMVKIPAGFSSGTFAYDVFMGRYYDSPRFTQEQWTAPIKGLLEDKTLTDPDWFDFDDFFPSAQAITVYGRYQDRLPITAEASILVYRKDIYEELGLDVPTTFDELLETVKKINATGKINGITVRGGPGLWMPFYGILKSYGGDWYTKDDEVKIGTPESIEAAKMLTELAQYTPPGVTGFGWDQINTAMLSGVAATFIDSSVIYPRLQDPARSTVVGKIGAAPYLIGPAGRISNAHYWSICISNLSKNKPASWLFIQWATSKPIQKKLAIAGILPPRSSIWKDPEFGAAYSPDFIDAMNVTFETAVCLPSSQNSGPYLWGLLDALTRKIQEVIMEQTEAPTAMQELEKEWYDIMKQ